MGLNYNLRDLKNYDKNKYNNKMLFKNVIKIKLNLKILFWMRSSQIIFSISFA